MPRTADSDFSHLRQRAGLSIDEFAEEAGFSRRTVYRWESGEAPPRKAALHLLLDRVDNFTPEPRAQSKYRFIDMFAGIGGLRRGFASEPQGAAKRLGKAIH